MDTLETMAKAYCEHSQKSNDARESIDRMKRVIAASSGEMDAISDGMTQWIGRRTRIIQIDELTDLVMFWDADHSCHHIKIVKK